MNTSNTVIIEQEKEGYRYSTEPFLLADFAGPRAGWRVLDVGTGCGIIPLLLATREPRLEITAVEIQKPLYDSALKNTAANGLSAKIKVLLGDFIDLAPALGTFDLIISNPPYRKINSGRLNPDKVKKLARHELTLTLPLLVENSFPLLKPGGKIVLAYPLHRLDEVLRQLRLSHLNPHRLRFIHGSQGAKAKIFLVEAVKEQPAECIVEDSLYIYNTDGSYTQEMETLYVSFNYPGRSHRIREKRDGAGAC